MLAEQIPDPTHCWVRFFPRSWPGAGVLWLDLARRGLGQSSQAVTELDVEALAAPRSDVVYLPPVDSALETSRLRLVDALARSGTPLWVQSIAGSPAEETGPVWVHDLLQALATGDLESLDGLPAGAVAIWPLVSGYTDDPELWREGLARLARAGVARVQGICPELSPADRRHLVEVAGSHGFDKLFHGDPPSERAFAVAVDDLGMDPFLQRPLPSSPGRLRRNRALAAQLALMGELWLRLGWPESAGQALYGSSRWIDRESHDVSALAREGNLGVVSWLDAISRQAVQEIVETGSSTLLDELRSEYLDGSLEHPG